jgi:tetratricopeptide (TPR) repeat protein
MKKEEIKKDLIYDKIIGFINYINNNQKQVVGTLFGILIILIVFVTFTNKNENKKLSNNAYSSTYQNNYIDGSKDLALIGFTNILNEYSKSEAYNQAFIYSLSHAIEKNDIDRISFLLNDNKFDSDDNMLNSMYHKVFGDYYISINNLEKAVDSYKDAIDYSVNDDYTNKYEIILVHLYLKLNNYSAAQNLVSNINIDNLSYDNKNNLEDIKAKLNYLTN